MAEPAASRPALGDRCGLPRAGEAEHAHAHRRARAVRGRRAGARGVPRAHPLAPAPRAALPAEARRAAAGDRAAAVGRRPELQPRLPRAPHRAARARASEDALLQRCARGCSPSAWTARSRCGSCGWSRGCDGESVRAGLEDPPRGRRRRLRRRPRQRAVRPHARGPRADDAGAWVPQPEPSERRARRARADRRGARGAGGRHAARSARSRSPGEALDRAREVATGIGEVAWTALNAPPDTPFNVRARPAPADRGRARGPRRVQAGQGRVRHTVNDVVLAVVTGALAYFLQSRGRRTEGLELKARASRSRSARGPAGRARQPADPDPGPAAGLPRRPGRAAAVRQGGDGRAEGVAPGAGRVGDRLAAGLRAADASTPRPRG